MSDNIIQLNEQVIKTELQDLVKQSVEETLNNLLDQEAEELTKASKYERTELRKGCRSGHYMRNLQTTSGNVTLKVLNLKVFLLRLLSSSAIGAARAALRKPLLRCT